ncbi:hypothetical protein JY665_13895 [Staphylococcus aureus]|uniref:hypothetical protein n=1 Tax=Staphylococcus aureus TaxID=1280 RepID=UPI00044B7DAA|nr:hypothetical protein [Staphylococcus aureus]EVJ48741.1 hypothetical protein U042_02857 [Staphylococcus aureus UCIM6147]MBG3202956.1 hypothetical protein [Staphylococcus aureus]MBN5857055.1 hypothetical protein [Staphylococcus aureus]MBN5917038.1 hypothetical protein [Staphylococcus aureus]
MDKVLTIGVEKRDTAFLIKESIAGKKYFDDMYKQLNGIVNGGDYIYLTNETGEIYFYVKTDAITFFEYEQIDE